MHRFRLRITERSNCSLCPPIHTKGIRKSSCRYIAKSYTAEKNATVKILIYSSSGKRLTSSVQSLPIEFRISCLTLENASGGNTVCQIRVIFSRSLWPSKGKSQAMTSGNLSCGIDLDIRPRAFPCSCIATRSLMIL